MKYILSIDQSTSGTKAALLDESGRIIRKESMPHRQYYPAPGRVEHDAEEIYQNVRTVAARVAASIDSKDLAALAIANQRETTVLWERSSGKPVCPAIVWQDVRGASIARELSASAALIRERTGIQLSAYYPSCKAAAVFRENPALHARARAGEVLIGTIDSFLIYRLTGGRVFASDVSNASRTQWMNLKSLCWDEEILPLFGIERRMLAEEIRPSDALYGATAKGELPFVLPIAAALGDSHASLFAHGCHHKGMVKTSYGTGSSIMMNIGGNGISSENGLSTSVAFGFAGKTDYALEGNVTSSAGTLIWLRDEMELIDSLDSIEELAGSVEDTQGVCLVPAFSGLGAPYFDEGARAILYGMNRGTRRAHVLRAALESIAHQNEDVLYAMAADLKSPVLELRADGGGSVNGLLMQMQADISRLAIYCAAEKDLTALGAGQMAGLASGLYSYDALFEDPEFSARYQPQMPPDRARQMRDAWHDAVRRCRTPLRAGS